MAEKGPGQIVVTGTAGRASTATMISALLHARGERVLQLNGHWLHSPLEQIVVDGRPLTPEAIDSLGLKQPPGEPNVDALFAELLGQTGWDWVVVSGADPLAIDPAVAVLTPVLPIAGANAAEQATALLGQLPQAPVLVSAPQRESVLDILRPHAGKTGAHLIEVAGSCRLARERSDLDGQDFRLKTETEEYRLRLPVLGAFQIENAAAAAVAAEYAPHGKAGAEPLDPHSARAALESLRLPGRCELIKRKPAVIVDAASSPASLGRLAEFLRSNFSGRHVEIIVDAGSDLEATEAVKSVAVLQPEIIAAGAADLNNWSMTCTDAGLVFRSATSVSSAVETALEVADPADVLVVVGSWQAAAAARTQVLALLPPELRLN